MSGIKLWFYTILLFKITDFKVAIEKADIIVFLVAHNEFKNLTIDKLKIVIDFCGVRNSWEIIL